MDAAGSKDLGETDTLAVVGAAHAIREGGLTVVDIVAALDETGYEDAAARIMAMTAARLAGDYLQTAAIFDESLRVLSAVTDPNDYAGPGTGYEPGAGAAGRDRRDPPGPRGRGPAGRAGRCAAVPLLAAAGPGAARAGPAGRGHRGLARGRPGRVAHAVRAHRPRRARRAAGRAGGGGLRRPGGPVQRHRRPGPDRAGRGPAGRFGIGIGLQGKGTALIHRRDLAPLANLELYSVAPAVTPELYRLLGANAARHAKGATPDPARNPYTDEAIEARYHTTVIALMALERAWVRPGAPAEELSRRGSSERYGRRPRGAPALEVRGLSGRPVSELTLEAVRRGEVRLADLRIHPEPWNARPRSRRRTATRSWPRTCAAPRS